MVLLVNVSVVALPTKVSVAFGSVMVLSAVGSVTVSVVSYSLAVEPSNTMLASDRYNPLTEGEVMVLLVSVSAPASEAKSASVRAVLNSASVPVTVFVVRETLLLVNVSVVARPTKVSVDVVSVNDPVLLMLLMTGVVSVLLVSV